MTKRRPIPPSDAQLNAERLAMRGTPYSRSHAASMEASWHYEVRTPSDLRSLVRAVRRAYEDEVPTKLHDADIGEGGTPKMADRFVGYIDRPHQTDAPPGERPLASYLLTPFRAALDRMEKGGNEREMRAAIVRAITIEGQEPFDAVTSVAQKYPQTFARVFARLVAEDALRVFLNNMTDLKVDLHKEPEAA